MTTYSHDLHAHLDYAIDWSAWLSDGDTIDTAAWAADEGLVLTDDSLAGTVTTVWVAVDPDVSPGTVLTATCRVTTTAGRIDDQTLRFAIVNK